jgi:hypothetical protein
MMAEGLYSDALARMMDSNTYTKVMGLNLMGRLLMKNPKRESEATKLLKQSEELAAKLPFWYDKIDYIYIPEFELD